jgi:hypothetical protein
MKGRIFISKAAWSDAQPGYTCRMVCENLRQWLWLMVLRQRGPSDSPRLPSVLLKKEWHPLFLITEILVTAPESLGIS